MTKMVTLSISKRLFLILPGLALFVFSFGLCLRLMAQFQVTAESLNGLTAAVSVDICCHLGFIRNVDLASRGFYFVEVELRSGREDGPIIPPVRCFSCPSTIASKVRDTHLRPAPLLHMCNIHDERKVFQCRSFMIRYKGEVHELNDGCYWKYLIHNYPLETFGGTAPKATETLILKFRLMFADVAEDVDGDMDSDPGLFVPDDPQWTILAEQVLGLQCVGSGMHEYFPIRFDRSCYVNLDCMVHCAVSDIVISEEKCAAVLMTSFLDNAVSEDVSQVAAVCDIKARASSLDRSFDSLTMSLICNYYLLSASLAMLSKHCAVDAASNTDAPVTEDWKIIQQTQAAETFSVTVADTKDKLSQCSQLAEALFLVQELIQLCRLQCLSMFASMCSLFPRLMHSICKDLHNKYVFADSEFWRKQVLVHICRSEHASISWPEEENAVFAVKKDIEEEQQVQLQQQACDTAARGLKVFDYRVQQDTTKLPVLVVQQYSSRISASVCNVARRGGVYEGCGAGEALRGSYCSEIPLGSKYWITEAAPSSGTAGFLTVSQDPQGAGTSATANMENTGLPDVPHVSTVCSSVSVPHLVVLQHGFLGNHYDMRYLENALAVELSHVSTHVLSICSNDDCSEAGIAKMAENLVAELNEYIEENMPDLIDARTEGRVSFIGHSMGGLVVRKALEHRSLHYLRHRCHVYVSLATPHLGTQYSSSPLVSTGMWVLGQWGKSKTLKELALGDGILGDRTKSVLFKLSENNVLALFRKVIVVSSPGDMYVPSYSASLRLASGPAGSPSFSQQTTICDSVIVQMHRNILAQVSASNLVRITLANNEGEERSINAFIGRSAHICYLENKTVAGFLIKALLPFFECAI